MARQEAKLCVSIPASADLSAAQFRFVLTNSSGQIAVVASAGGDADGVLDDKPAAAGRPGSVQIFGIAKVVLGGTVTAGDKVQSDAAGAAITAASGDHVLGRALVGGASGALGEILLTSSHHILA